MAPLKRGETYVVDDKEKANILNNQYCSVFSEPHKDTPQINSPQAESTIEDIVIQQIGVLNLLNKLDPSKATGPDKISARFLKEFSSEIAPALTLFFGNSLSQGDLPSEWRHAFIVPVYKGNNKERSSPESYRPVSLTSVCCKVMEHIIYSSIMKHLNDNNILSDEQHGFRNNRFCESQLLITINDFATRLNDKEQIDTILLDFSKAFDKVNHYKLGLKLSHYGIKGNCLKWILSFLNGRTQQVVLNGTFSNPADVISGVPQGTVLGPLLFLLYINDMPAFLKSCLRLFADDAYLYRCIKSLLDMYYLQDDLNQLQTWERNWDMEFHPQKCKLLSITNKTKPVATTYTIHDEALKSVETAKYLGVTLHKKLKWNKHVSNICSKAHQRRSFLQRNLRGCSKRIKIMTYKTYVLPIIMYASSVWDPTGPSNNGLRLKLESVQRKAARFVYNNWSWEASPTTMMKELKWRPTELLRKISSLVMLHKIINKNIDIPKTMLPKRSRDGLKFQQTFGRILAYSNSFVPMVTKWWNELPLSIISLNNELEFKSKITEHFKVAN